jgi:hypothetical protein
MFHEDLRDWISVGIHDGQLEEIEFGTAALLAAVGSRAGLPA